MLKYKDLIIELQHKWNVVAKVIPVIKGATGTISQPLRQYLSNLPGKHKIKDCKKSHIGNCTHTARSANVKHKMYFTGRITVHVAQTVNTEQLQHCIP
jgi:hypothetical protein